jgi:hypothetical protein
MPVQIEGIVEIQKAMRKFAPDLLKELQQEVRPLLKSVTDAAKAKLPTEMGWELRNFNNPGYERQSRTGKTRAFPSYDAGEVRKGLTYSLATSRKNRSGYVSVARLLNKSAAGGIIETAGRKNINGRPKTHEITINKRYKPTKMTVSSSKDSQSNNPDAGGQFIRALSNSEVGPLKQYGRTRDSRGRLLFAAWYEHQNRVMPLVVKAYEKAAMKFKSRLDLAA